MAKVSYVVLPLLLAAASAALACSNHESSDSSDSDRIVVNASKETRSRIGVASWGFDVREDVGEPATVVVHGYDGGHARVLEYKQSRPGPGMLSATLDANGTKADLALRKSDETTSEVVSNSFKDNDEALRILRRLAADLNGQSRSSGGLSSTTSYGSGLRVTDDSPIVNPGKTCLVLLPQSANWPTQCAERPLGMKCQTPPETDSSAQCDRIGDPVCPAGFVLGKDGYDSKPCARVDGIHKERGEQLFRALTNCSSQPDTGEQSSTSTRTVDKKITVETTKSNTVTFGASAEVQVGYEEKAEANVELADVSTSLSAQIKAGVNYSDASTTTDSQATSQGEQYIQTYSEKYTAPVQPYTTLTRYLENDVIDYTLVTYTRTNNYWVKSEGTGHVKIPTGERRVDTPASCN